MAQPERVREAQRLREHEGTDPRVQHELKQLQEETDLREIDDDVEDLTTLYEWEALEHRDHPLSPRWFVAIAAGTTVVAVVLLLMANIIGALATALVGGLFYYFLQQQPAVARYRLMVDGIAINNTLYHYKELASFNIIYEPDVTKTVLVKSKHRLTPMITLEIGEADPLVLRDILLEFLPEDQDLEEPLVDVLARRVGF